MPARRAGTFIVLFVATAASRVAPQRSPVERQHHDTLANGLQVITVANHAAPLATVLIAVRGGAFTQQPGDQGLAHLYEHLLFRSYGRDPSAFGEAASRLNANYNGTTSDEVVTYYLMVPSDKTRDAIRLLAQLVMRARFSDADLREERRVVLDELERAQSDPERALARRVEEHLWGDAWHRKDTGGDSASLQAITLDRLKETYERYYIPNNSALIVTGDVSPAAVHDAVKRHFGKWQRRPDPFAGRAPPPPPPLRGHRAVLMPHDVLDVTILVQLHGPSLRSDTASSYAADVLFEVLNDPSSALQRRLVESGLCQSISASYLTLSDVGPIAIRARTTSDRARDALFTLMGELDGLELLTDITAEDLAVAKKRRHVAGALAFEQTAALAPGLAFWWASAGIDYYLTYHERMNGQTLDDVRRFATAYVVDKPRVIGVLAPAPVIDDLATLFRVRGDGGP